MLEILELIFHKQFFHLLWLESGGNLGDLFIGLVSCSFQIHRGFVWGNWMNFDFEQVGKCD